MWDFHSFAFIWLGFYYFSFSVLVGSARSYFEKPSGTNYVRNNVSSSCEWRPYKKAIVGMVISFLSNMFSLVNCDLFKCVIGKEYRYIYLYIFFKGLVIPCSTLLESLVCFLSNSFNLLLWSLGFQNFTSREYLQSVSGLEIAKLPRMAYWF